MRGIWLFENKLKNFIIQCKHEPKLFLGNIKKEYLDGEDDIFVYSGASDELSHSHDGVLVLLDDELAAMSICGYKFIKDNNKVVELKVFDEQILKIG